MTTIALPDLFSKSYSQFGEYPLNVVLRGTYGIPILKRIRERHQERTPYLFKADRDTKISIIDLFSDGTVDKRNLYSDVEIKKWLGDISNGAFREAPIMTKKDPECRFVFLLLEAVTSALSISAQSAARLMTYHQISPKFFDFLDAYGIPSGINRELRFNGFRTETYLADPDPGLILPELGRSGRCYQISYSLKTANRQEWMKEPITGLSLWQLRQTAIHHQFDIGSGVQLWVFGDTGAALQTRIAEIVSSQQNHQEMFKSVSTSFKSSLQTQMNLAKFSMEGWREYLQYLEETVEDVISRLVLSRPNQPSQLRTEEVFHAQWHEDTINECIMTLESNADNMTSLSVFYASLVKHDDFPSPERQACEKDVKSFASQLGDLIYDAKMQARRAGLLAKIMADRKALFVQLLQVQLQARSADRAARLSATMWRQAEETSHEAIAMRVITVITLLYLPPTFVSVRSKHIVKYQGDNGDLNHDIFSRLALERFLQVTAPLMVLTFAVAFGWVWYERISGKERTASLEKEYPEVFGPAKD
ncbi:hypothetical protein G7054_g12937 [Neopestalotiopsis clavispora]|nr:hypothetical protein G7054_g12937 [Neopestalotiopsis clavispora]